MSFTEWMINERKRRKWNRTRVSNKIGVHVNTMGRWEREESAIPFEMAEKIADMYGYELKIVCK